MALIANNIIITTSYEEITEQIVNNEDINKHNNILVLKSKNKRIEKTSHYILDMFTIDNDINQDHDILIVNGKNKKIGKKSQYLLDMLTLDDD